MLPLSNLPCMVAAAPPLGSGRAGRLPRLTPRVPATRPAAVGAALLGGVVVSRQHRCPALRSHRHHRCARSPRRVLDLSKALPPSPVRLNEDLPGSAPDLGKRTFCRELGQLILALETWGLNDLATSIRKTSDLQEIPRPPEPPAFVERLKLNVAKVVEREAQRGVPESSPVVKAIFFVLCWSLDRLYEGRPIQKFWVLETVARLPYFSYITVLHLYESLGWWRSPEIRHIHSAEEDNELHHLLIMEALGGDVNWFDRFAAQHAALAYYWIVTGLFVFSPENAYNFSHLVEEHAYVTYQVFAEENAELLRRVPPPPIAVKYYVSGDLYNFDKFQTRHREEHRRTCLQAHNNRGYHCLCHAGWRGYACERTDLCYPTSPCLNGGTCFNALDTFICHCPLRYSGKHCGNDKCKRCDINANCVNGTCECNHGFVGNGFTCTPVGDPCQPNPCENGGKCNPGHGEKLFECVCREGFTGAKCEVSRSACTSNPCVNGGTCVDVTNNDGSLLEGVIFTNHSQYKCVCPKGYAGNNCQKLVMTNPCSTHPCLNNGTCFDDTNSAGMNLKLLNALDFRCFCPIGYSGIVCEIPRSACHSSPCLHGGTCLDSSNTADVAFNANGYKCLCFEGFVGMNCEASSSSSVKTPLITEVSLQGTARPLTVQFYKPTVQVVDVNASPGGRPKAVPLVIAPQMPKESVLVGAVAGPPKTTLPVVVPSKPNAGLTAEVEKSHENQVGVIMIPQSAQPLPRTSTGSQPPPRPPIVQAYGPSSSLGSNSPMASAPSQLGYVTPTSPPTLPYMASPNLEAASSNAAVYYAVPGAKAIPAQSPSAGLISSPPVIPSLFTGVASSPAITQASAIVMPPGLRPPPGDGRLTLGLPGGIPRLGTQRHYQPGYTGYYSYKDSRRYQTHNPVSYRNSRYPYFQKQWYSKRNYPASSYPGRGMSSTNKFQRRYRQTENGKRVNRDADGKAVKVTSSNYVSKSTSRDEVIKRHIKLSE